jgi:hypothetical protein
MKALKFSLFALLLPASIMVSCKKIQDSENPSQASPPGIPAAGSRIVSTITKSTGSNSHINKLTYDNNNRLIGIERAETASVSITYKTGTPEESLYTNSVPYTVIVEYQDESDPTGAYGWTGVYTSGDNGYLTSGNMIYDYENGSNEQRIWTGIHDSEGYLTNSKWNNENNIGLYDATWTDGNMMRLYSGEGEVVTDYEYNNLANNPLCNLDLNHLYHLFTDNWIDPFTAILELSGKRSANMVSKATEVYSYPYSSKFITTYTYQTDAKGFVTKITQTRREADSNSSNIFTSTSVYTITYR